MNAPGADIVERGLRDLAAGVDSIESLLVAIGAPRLRALGIDVPPDERLPRTPEHRLYERLSVAHGRGAHSRYNAWVRRLVSFERALGFARARDRRMSARPRDPSV